MLEDYDQYLVLLIHWSIIISSIPLYCEGFSSYLLIKAHLQCHLSSSSPIGGTFLSFDSTGATG